VSELSEAFETYRNATREFGATTQDCLAPPATTEELRLLEERLGRPLPDQVVEWFSLANGLQYGHPNLRLIVSTYLFAGLVPRSTAETIAALDERDKYFPPEIQEQVIEWSSTAYLPILTAHDRWDTALLVDASGESNRLFTYALERHPTESGYYHEDLVSFLTQSTKIVRDGFFKVLEGGLMLDQAAWTPNTTTLPIWLFLYGFDARNGYPPRVGPDTT
jgi:hypothetical protein